MALFLSDEDFDHRIAMRLRTIWRDILTLAVLGLAGRRLPDEQVLATATVEKRARPGHPIDSDRVSASLTAMSAATLMLEISRGPGTDVLGHWSVDEFGAPTVLMEPGELMMSPFFMSRITPEDARAPGGVVGRDEKLTRSQFVRRLGKGLLGYGAAAAGLGSLAFPRRSHGALYQDGTTSAQTTNMGQQFQGKALSFQINVPGQGFRSVSATFLNSRFALSTKHNVADLLQLNPTYEVADGTNAITRGNIMSVTNIIFHPALDLIILGFAQPFYASQNKEIGTAVTDDITYSAGFGSWGTPSIGLISPRDGNLRAWDARVYSAVIGFSAPYYQSTTFGFGNTNGLSLNARGAISDSGGPVFNIQGELIGVNVNASTAIASAGSTTYVYLGEPTTKAWIEANTQIPKPQMQCSIEPNGMLVSWDINAVGWILQESPNLSTWTDVGTTILAPGSYPFQGNDGQQFFRFRKP